MLGILAQVAGPIAGYSLAQILITVIILAAVVGIVVIALKQFGIVLPQWVLAILTICVVALVAIVAIRFVLSL